VRHLHKHHRHQMAPHRVAVGLGIHPMLPGGGLEAPLRNILEKLPQRTDMMTWRLGGWRRSCWGWHPNSNSTRVPLSTTQLQRLGLPPSLLACGMPVKIFDILGSLALAEHE
jgi:hypothetical protein